MRQLKGSERKYLRGLAHPLRPVVQVGKDGVTDGVVAAIDEVLDAHELIKVRFVDHKDQKRALTDEIEQRLGCEAVGTIGHVAILFRRHADPDQQLLELPFEVE